MKQKIIVLSWGCPWPPLGGGTLRTMGLVRELARYYSVRLFVLSSCRLTVEQETELLRFSDTLTVISMAGATLRDKASILLSMFARRIPYHAAVTWVSMRRNPAMAKQITAFPGVVYAISGHWGVLVSGHVRPNWILDQPDNSVDFWRVYASQDTRWWAKIAALINWRLAAIFFPKIFPRMGLVVSVCESDQRLTLEQAPAAKVAVIENGVDCGHYQPSCRKRQGHPRLLFTGTSVPRNITALRHFVANIWPRVLADMPDAELLVAGNFHPKAQLEFKSISNLRFTGKVADIRPYFDQSDVFVAPFSETHGSKLKIAEAMAMGMPIVSTPVGIRGFALKDGVSVLLASDDRQFTRHIVDLLRDENMRNRLGREARKTAMETIDWKLLGKRLSNLVAQLSVRLPALLE